MALSPSHVKRTVDTDGSHILTYNDGTNEIQAVRIVEPTYEVNDVAEVGTIMYVGCEAPITGSWLVKKVDTISGIVIRYATMLNNPTVATYAAAWAARLTLTYETLLSARDGYTA